MLPLINKKLGAAFTKCGVDPTLATVKFSDRPDLCDLQCNGLLRFKDMELVKRVAEAVYTEDMFTIAVVAPGFLNITVGDEFLTDYVIMDRVLGGPIRDKGERIIIDYGGPNVAKPLHVGHLRSAIIGQSLKRIAEELGHLVVGDIHLGDWGTPMGMLIAELQEHPVENLTANDLNAIYPHASRRFAEDEEFAARARHATTLLQNKGEAEMVLWSHMVDISVAEIKRDFDALGVSFELWNGESNASIFVSYVESLLSEMELLVTDNGAQIVHVAGNVPLMFRKSDGAITYAATDLATIEQRSWKYHPDRIFYVVDKRQTLHFKQVFEVAQKSIVSVRKPIALEHIGFGTVNGLDGKPYKTRDGGVMRLRDFIQQAIEMATIEAGYDGQEIDADTQAMLEMIALGAVKFADLSNLRTSDYIFNPAESVRFTGKTGPYVQYAYVRCKSILQKVEPKGAVKNFTHAAERQLIVALLKYQPALQTAFDKRMPHLLCEYVYFLAQTFSNFYSECDILHLDNEDVKSFRAFLVQMTADTIKKSLECLGIPAPEKMTRGDHHGD
jgi:arginyl-tRNA synthetase